MTLYVLAQAEALPERVHQLNTILLTLAEQTREENGCLSYQLFYDSNNPARVNSIEIWKNAEAFSAHMESAHVTAALQAMQTALAVAPDIRILRELS